MANKYLLTYFTIKTFPSYANTTDFDEGLVPYSDVGTYNFENTFLGSDGANLKLSKWDNHGN